MKITIETDGYYKTTAECNGITAESLCNPADEFNLPKGVHMAVQRLLEKLKQPKGGTAFHVGDIVEVVSTVTHFLRESVGLQGKVVRYNKWDDMWLITLPIKFEGDYTWYFYNRELKLIRRGNN
jgi:aspartyl-tRNA synthetase